MPVINWVRTGTDNQKIQFKAVQLPEVSVPENSSSSSSEEIGGDSGSSSSVGDALGSSASESAVKNLAANVAPAITFDKSLGTVRFEGYVRWHLFSVNGHLLNSGEGSLLNLSNFGRGAYLVRAGNATLKVVW